MAMFGNKTWPPPSQPSHKCAGITRKGLPCERHVAPGEIVCNLHQQLPVSREQVLASLLTMVNPVLARLMRLANSKNERVALDACRDLLDRVGIMRHTGLHVHRETDAGEISAEEAAERARQVLAILDARRVTRAAMLQGEVSDAE
jgi:hypothetical protein